MEVARAVDDVLAAVFPGTCPCGARGEPCCARCRAALTPPPAAPPPPGIDWWVAAFAYEGVARELVARAKYRNARASFAWLGAAIVASSLPRACDRDIVTWVPGESRASTAVRGVDHGELLARAVARELHLPVRALLHRAPGAATDRRAACRTPARSWPPRDRSGRRTEGPCRRRCRHHRCFARRRRDCAQDGGRTVGCCRDRDADARPRTASLTP